MMTFNANMNEGCCSITSDIPQYIVIQHTGCFNRCDRMNTNYISDEGSVVSDISVNSDDSCDDNTFSQDYGLEYYGNTCHVVEDEDNFLYARQAKRARFEREPADNVYDARENYHSREVAAIRSRDHGMDFISSRDLDAMKNMVQQMRHDPTLLCGLTSCSPNIMPHGTPISPTLSTLPRHVTPTVPVTPPFVPSTSLVATRFAPLERKPLYRNSSIGFVSISSSTTTSGVFGTSGTGTLSSFGHDDGDGLNPTLSSRKRGQVSMSSSDWFCQECN